MLQNPLNQSKPFNISFRVTYLHRSAHVLNFLNRMGSAGPTIKALLDSGASESLISKKYVSKLRVKSSKKKGTVWSTPGGDLHTNSRVMGQFTIPELQDKKLIKWDLHVVENMGAYDMIIGRDIHSCLLENRHSLLRSAGHLGRIRNAFQAS
jgi:Aspartyl protease